MISGVLDSLYRPEAENLIKKHGGRVTGSVSGKTSFLLCGENTGQTKLQAVSTDVSSTLLQSSVQLQNLNRRLGISCNLVFSRL